LRSNEEADVIGNLRVLIFTAAALSLWTVRAQAVTFTTSYTDGNSWNSL
jgi:hypothetical protein